MKKLILTIAIAISGYSSYAQWTGAPGNIYYNTGTVGIGITNPSEMLTIKDPNIAYDSTSGVVKIRFDSGGGGGGIGFEKETFNTGGLRFYTQYGFGSMLEKMRITATGNVGIGTTSPGHKLEVNGNSYFASDIDVNGISSSTNSIGLNVSGGTPQLYLRGSTASNTIGGSASLFFMDNTNVDDWALQADGSYNLGFWRYAGGWNKIAGITPTGGAFFGDNVSIGTTDPQGYKLAVKGTIHTQEVKVDMTGWNDYVFDKTYPLKSLSAVKSYIDENHHLPDVPSEAEVIKSGVNVGEMLKLQTKKIEELTLYLIDKDKQLTEQQKKNDAQEARIAALEKALLKLTETQSKINQPYHEENYTILSDSYVWLLLLCTIQYLK